MKSRLVLLLCILLVACGGALKNGVSPIKDVRQSSAGSNDPEIVGAWVIAEAIRPGGDPAQLAIAEKKLASLPSGGLQAALARALLGEAHGSPKIASDGFVAVLDRAQGSNDAIAPLAAWYAVHRLRALRGLVAGLWNKSSAVLERVRRQPGSIGWRAEAELMDWATTEAFDKDASRGKEYDERVVRDGGCARGVRIAGPFGRGAAADRRRSYPAERPGPWPPAWPDDAKTGTIPSVRKTQQPRCLAVSTERAGQGVFYAETFVTTKSPMDAVIAIQGAVAVWVDDVLVLERDLRDWGIWQKFGAAVRITPGRHRVVARVIDDVVSIRILAPDGLPAMVETSADPTPGYAMGGAIALRDPNPLTPVVAARKGQTPLETFLAALLAHGEGLDDVAGVLLEPLVTPEDAAPLALEAAANTVRGDPLYSQEVRRRMEKTMRARAVAKDPKLWVSRVSLAISETEQKGLFEGVAPLQKLAAEFPEEPEISEGLSHVYGRLAWRAERLKTLADVATRFPDYVDGLRAYRSALEEDGSVKDADVVAERIQKLDPEAELELERALERHDWKAALAELDRIAKRRPDRKDIANRIASVLAKSGDPSAAAKQLAKAIATHPDDSASRFRLADFAYAAGDEQALRKALAEALHAGGNTQSISSAIDLLEGATDLEPYRIDGRKVISEFVAWEKGGKKMEGVSARVLDYAAVWVHPDGSSEMLEHEIQKLQSQEAIGKEAEQKAPEGLVLRLRVIKPDGRILEPEPIAGKPTLTMPHMDVGDFLEVEHIVSSRGDGEKGRRYRGPHWFFREADKGYWRSEFITVSPKDKPIEVETRGNVPPPVTKTKATLIERRWRIEQSPPIPEEAYGAPPVEYLPSVRLGWGISIDETLERLVDAVSDETPLDPRLHAYALDMVRDIPNSNIEAQAQKIYRTVQDKIQEGPENDGRRVVTGKSGSRQNAFLHLMKQLGIPVEIALVKDKLAMPPLGKMSEVENWDSLVLRIGGKTPIWLTVRDKFAPFGYVPAENRGQPAYRLVLGSPKDVVSSSGAQDAAIYQGRADVHDDGSASVDLALQFSGKIAISMRNLFDRLPEARVKDFIEGRLLAASLPGARVKEFSIEHPKDIDVPLIVHVKADVPTLVKTAGSRLVLQPTFSLHIVQFASLQQRQTPMVVPTTYMEVHFDVVVPQSWKVPSSLPPSETRDGERVVTVKDSILKNGAGHSIRLDRVIDIPAGRIQPGAPYEVFTRFCHDADASFEREIVLSR